jgi:hypothetical protein
MEWRELAGEVSPTLLLRLSGDKGELGWLPLPVATSSSPYTPSPRVGRAPAGCEDATPEKKVRRLALFEDVLNRRVADEISSRSGGW